MVRIQLHGERRNWSGKAHARAADLTAARSDLQAGVDSLQKLIQAVDVIHFPANVDQDVRSFITASNGYLGALQTLAGDPNDSHFGAKIDAVNSAITTFSGAENLLDRDLLMAVSQNGG